MSTIYCELYRLRSRTARARMLGHYELHNQTNVVNLSSKKT